MMNDADLEKARKHLATNPEQKALLSKFLEERTRDPVAEQNARDILKKEKANLATAAEKKKRSQEQQIADKRPIRSTDPEEVERTEYFGKPLYERERPSRRVKSKRVKSKRRTQHRNTRK
jgi:hypothetical protein